MLFSNKPMKWWINDSEYMKVISLSCRLRCEYESDPCHNKHYLSSSWNKARKNFRPVLIKPPSFYPFCSQSITTSISESKWSRWSSWSDCTKTCGSGSRYRNRTCVAINKGAVSTPISCAGKSLQTVSCAEWNCPGRHVLLECIMTLFFLKL